MILNPKDAAIAIREHGLPDLFVKVVLGQHKRMGHGIPIHFERPSEFYRLISESPDDFPFAETIIPLHESNRDHFWCFVPQPEPLFLEHSIEWRPAEHRVIARTVSEYVAFELDRLCDCGAEAEDIRAIGTILGHPDIESVVRDNVE